MYRARGPLRLQINANPCSTTTRSLAAARPSLVSIYSRQSINIASFSWMVICRPAADPVHCTLSGQSLHVALPNLAILFCPPVIVATSPCGPVTTPLFRFMSKSLFVNLPCEAGIHGLLTTRIPLSYNSAVQSAAR
jgi:hypothetical protein